MFEMEKSETLKLDKRAIAPAVLYGACFAFMALWYLVKNENLYGIITAVVAFAAGIYLFLSGWRKVLEFAKAHKFVTALVAIVGAYMLYMILLQRDAAFFGIQIIKLRFLPIAFAGWSFAAMLGVSYAFEVGKNLAGEMGEWDKKAYIIATIAISALLIICYGTFEGWYLQYDKVYSMDSGFVFNNIFPKPDYYDIRHPLYSVFSYPIYSLVYLVSSLFAPSSMLTKLIAILLQLLNAQTIIITAFMLKKMTDDSKEVFYLYLLSYSVIMYTMLFEKYQLCVFMLVSFVYASCKDGKNDGSAVAMATLMPTSVFAAVGYLFKKAPWKEKILTAVRIVVEGCAFVICFGRVNIFFTGLTELNETTGKFLGKEWVFTEKLISFSKMIVGIFLPLNSRGNEDNYRWRHFLSTFNWLFAVIMLLIVIGIIVSIRNDFTKFALIWLLFAYVLIVHIEWGTKESPLFAFYFAWAAVPMLKAGVDYIAGLFGIKASRLFVPIYSLMAVTAFLEMVQVNTYMHTLF